MRPPHFCGGNLAGLPLAGNNPDGFNEAPAFLRGKLECADGKVRRGYLLQ